MKVDLVQQLLQLLLPQQRVEMYDTIRNKGEPLSEWPTVEAFLQRLQVYDGDSECYVHRSDDPKIWTQQTFQVVGVTIRNKDPHLVDDPRPQVVILVQKAFFA